MPVPGPAGRSRATGRTTGDRDSRGVIRAGDAQPLEGRAQVGNTLFALVWVLNFASSVWNAYAVGKVWVEVRLAGGWHRFMCWMGAVMSACGFTWCYLSFLALTAHHFQWLTDDQVLAALNLGYVLLLPFILFGGYAITLDSWAQAFRRGGLPFFGGAGVDPFAGTPTPVL